MVRVHFQRLYREFLENRFCPLSPGNKKERISANDFPGYQLSGQPQHLRTIKTLQPADRHNEFLARQHVKGR